MKPDIQKRLIEHVRAMENAKTWATKGLALVEAGKIRQAREAQRKAEFWIAKARKLEGARE